MRRMLTRSRLEYTVVIWEVFVLGIAALSFQRNPNTATLDRVAADLGIYLTNDLFAVGCVLGMFISMLTLLADTCRKKRYFYTTAINALVIYTLPIGYYAIATSRTGFVSLSAFAYVMLWVPFLLIAWAAFREDNHAAVAQSTADVSAASTTAS